MDDTGFWRPARHQFHQSPGGDLIAHHHVRQVHHADTGDGRMAQGQQVIGDHPRRMPDQRRAAIGAEQFPLIFTLRRAPVQARQTAEVGQ
ncbi:hypothetical protein D3C86_2012770 [compost metagenome]